MAIWMGELQSESLAEMGPERGLVKRAYLARTHWGGSYVAKSPERICPSE